MGVLSKVKMMLKISLLQVNTLTKASQRRERRSATKKAGLILRCVVKCIQIF